MSLTLIHISRPDTMSYHGYFYRCLANFKDLVWSDPIAVQEVGIRGFD